MLNHLRSRHRMTEKVVTTKYLAKIAETPSVIMQDQTSIGEQHKQGIITDADLEALVDIVEDTVADNDGSSSTVSAVETLPDVETDVSTNPGGTESQPAAASQFQSQEQENFARLPQKMLGLNPIVLSECPKCSRAFTNHHNYRQHVKTCMTPRSAFWVGHSMSQIFLQCLVISGCTKIPHQQYNYIVFTSSANSLVNVLICQFVVLVYIFAQYFFKPCFNPDAFNFAV